MSTASARETSSWLSTESGAADSGSTPTLDPRAEKTKQAIFEAIQTLMPQRAEAISVSDIVRTAGISRSSFYVHFSGLTEVATHFLRRQFDEVEAAELSPDEFVTGSHAAREGYRRLVTHMVDHYPLYVSVLDQPLARGAYDELIDSYANRLLQSIAAYAAVPPGVKPEVVTTYVSGGALTLISAWMKGLVDVSDDELVEVLVDLLPSWLVDAQP